MNRSRWLALAGLLMILELAFLGARPYPGSWALKAAPILVLAVFVARGRGTLAQRALMTVGLLLSGCGDIALDDPNHAQLALGLGFFLSGYVLYVIALLKEREPTGARWLRALFPIAYDGWFIATLWPALGEMRAAVAAYALVLALLAVAGALRRGWLAYFGACLMIVSDSLIGMEAFLHAGPYPVAIEVGLYYVGQLCVVAGFSSPSKTA
jgi:uncharacterized membrane protein YhhN